MVPPFTTEARTSFIAFSTTLLPEVLPTMSIASSIGTPAATSAENVREKRAMQTFCTMPPIFHGILSLNMSHCIRPELVAFHFLKLKTAAQTRMMATYHLPVMKSESATVTFVI